MSQVVIGQVSRSTPFDNSTNGFVSTNAQEAIEEVKSALESQTRFAITCGFDGTASSGRYLEFSSNVDSNQSGLTLPRNAIIKELSFAINTAGTVTFTVYSYNGTSETSLTSLSVTSGRTASVNGLNISVASGLELRVKCTSGSGSRPVFALFMVFT
jgi:hypothetical protein